MSFKPFDGVMESYASLNNACSLCVYVGPLGPNKDVVALSS